MKVAVGSDHRGHAARAQVAGVLEHLGHEVVMFGSPEGKVEDYPDVAFAAAGMVSRGEADRAVLLAASGIGMSIAANKLPGVRAAVCIDDWMAVVSRQSFDANVLCLSVEMFEDNRMLSILGLWMSTEFEGGRHARRIEKILAAEGRPATAPPLS